MKNLTIKMLIAVKDNAKLKYEHQKKMGEWASASQWAGTYRSVNNELTKRGIKL